MVIEVETDDSIYDQHTEDQWRLFAAHAKNIGGAFVVVVPRGCVRIAKARLNQLNLEAEIWEA